MMSSPENGSSPENRTLTKKEAEDQKLVEFVGSFTVDRLQSEQRRLEQFITDFQENLSEMNALAPASTEIAKELIAGEVRLLEAIRMQRGRLGDRPEIPRAPRLALEHAPTEYPGNVAPTVAPRARKRDQDIGTNPTMRPN